MCTNFAQNREYSSISRCVPYVFTISRGTDIMALVSDGHTAGASAKIQNDCLPYFHFKFCVIIVLVYYSN